MKTLCVVCFAVMAFLYNSYSCEIVTVCDEEGCKYVTICR